MTADVASIATEVAFGGAVYGKGAAKLAKNIAKEGLSFGLKSAAKYANPAGVVLAAGDVAGIAGDVVDFASGNEEKDLSDVGTNVVSEVLSGVTEHYENSMAEAAQIRADVFDVARDSTADIPVIGAVVGTVVGGAEVVSNFTSGAMSFAGGTVVDVVDGFAHLSDSIGEATGIAQGVRKETYDDEYVKADVGEAAAGGLGSLIDFGLDAAIAGGSVAYNGLFDTDELKSVRSELAEVPVHDLHAPNPTIQNVRLAGGDYVDGCWLEFVERGEVSEDQYATISALDKESRIDALVYYCAGGSVEKTLELAESGTLPHDEDFCNTIALRNADITHMYGEYDSAGNFSLFEDGIHFEEGLYLEDQTAVEYDAETDTYYALDDEGNRGEEVAADDVYRGYVTLDESGEYGFVFVEDEEEVVVKDDSYGSNLLFDTNFINGATNLVSAPEHEVCAPIPTPQNVKDAQGDYVMACWNSLADTGDISADDLARIANADSQAQTEALIYYCAGASVEDTVSNMESDTLLTNDKMTQELEQNRNLAGVFGMVNEEDEYVLWEDGVHLSEGYYTTDGFAAYVDEETGVCCALDEKGELVGEVSPDDVFVGYIKTNENGEYVINAYTEDEVEGIVRAYKNASSSEISLESEASGNIFQDYIDEKIDTAVDKVSSFFETVGAVTGNEDLKALGQELCSTLESFGEYAGNVLEDRLASSGSFSKTAEQEEDYSL